MPRARFPLPPGILGVVAERQRAGVVYKRALGIRGRGVLPYPTGHPRSKPEHDQEAVLRDLCSIHSVGRRPTKHDSRLILNVTGTEGRLQALSRNQLLEG